MEERIARLPKPGPGRSPLFANPDEMFERGEAYFTDENRPWSIAELGLHLGLSYQGLLEYSRKPGFSETVRQLKSRILMQAEKALYDKEMVNGAKFHAAQLGMSEKVEQTTQSTNLNVSANVVLEHLTDDQLAKLADAIALVTDSGANRGGAGAPEAQQNPIALPGSGAAAP